MTYLAFYGSSFAPVRVPDRLGPPFYGLPLGTDTRGMGWEFFDGRGPVRKSAGTTRPPTIQPEVWQGYSPGKKAIAIEEYLAQIASDATAFGGVAAPATGVISAQAELADWQARLLHDDDIPRLPREFEALREPHRERNGTWHPPGCIARKLSKKELDACPKARKALDAEWEKLRFLKRPHPVQGQGAWDEGNVREASSVRGRSLSRQDGPLRTYCRALPREGQRVGS